jgi:hypothetical protein
MAWRVPPLWATVVDRSPLLLASGCLGFLGVAAAAHVAGSLVAPFLYVAALVVGAVLAWRLARGTVAPCGSILYHSDADGIVVAPSRGRTVHLAWDGIVEVREGWAGGLTLATRDARVTLPGHLARHGDFGHAVLARVVPRLAAELWEQLACGRMVALRHRGYAPALACALGVGAGAILVLPGAALWLPVLVAAAIGVVVIAGRRGRGDVFLSAHGIGRRSRFVGWDGAEVREGWWTLSVRDPTSGWMARIPRSARNYHALAVVARAAAALAGETMESVVFRPAYDGDGVRIIVEGRVLAGGGQGH